MAKKAHRRKASGPQSGRLAALRQSFLDDAQRLASPVSDETLTAAAGYWMGYPTFREIIECNSDGPDESYPAVAALDLAHVEATKLLMREAGAAGLDPMPLWESHRVCREVFLTWKPWSDGRPGRADDLWPECLGAHRYELPQGQQEAIRDGEAVFMRLALGFGIQPGQWSAPDGLSQWAKKFGFSTTTLKRRFKAGAIRHKKDSSKSYRIHIDDLPK